MDLMEALREHGEAGAAIVDLLYGDAAFEVSKALSDSQKSERTQQRIAQASNVVGIGAGLAAIPGAVSATRAARTRVREAKGVAPKANTGGTLRPLARLKGTANGRKVLHTAASAGKKLATPKAALAIAGGNLALQAGNTGGDFVTNRVLARGAKKDKVSKGVDDIEWSGEITKMDVDKRQVFGWASVTSVNGVPVKDLQGDEIDLEEIEKAAYDYVITSRKGGNMHQKTEDGPLHVSDLIESFVVSKSKREQMNLPAEVPDGWWVGFHVNDDATWQDAKDGKLVEFSIHGTGKRV